MNFMFEVLEPVIMKIMKIFRSVTSCSLAIVCVEPKDLINYTGSDTTRAIFISSSISVFLSKFSVFLTIQI